MKITKVNCAEEFDAVRLRSVGGYYEMSLLLFGEVIYKEKYLIGLFNKYHFTANMQELGIDQNIINNELLTYFK